MADMKNFSLSGIGPSVQFGKAGSRIKFSTDHLEARNAADNAFVDFFVPLTPGDNQAAASKAYVDAFATGLTVQESVLAATTANLSSFSAGQFTSQSNVLDGVTLADDDVVLVKDQSAPGENGIYDVTTAGSGANGVWDRRTDFDTAAELDGAFFFVEDGTANAASGWVINVVKAGFTINTTAITVVQFSQAGAYTAAGGMNLTGGAFNVDIFGESADTTVIDTDIVLIEDAAGGTLAKMTRADFIGSLTFTMETSQVIVLDGGIVGTPGLTFSGDLDTGIFSDTDNIIEITAGGAARVTAQVPSTTQSSVLFPGTGAITVPVGTTGARPSVPTNGMIRYNTTLNVLEWYDANLADWEQPDTGASNSFGIITGDTGTATADTPADTLQLQGATSGGVTTVGSDAPELVTFSITPIDLGTSGVTIASGDFIILSDSADSATDIALKVTFAKAFDDMGVPYTGGTEDAADYLHLDGSTIMTGVATMSDLGTLTTPDLTWTGDLDTGLAQIGPANTLSIIGQGDEIVRFDGVVASAVNFFSMANADTGNAPIITNLGTDTNGAGLGLTFTAKTATATGVGGPLVLNAGAGNGTGAGGAFTLTTGNTAVQTSGTAGASGAITLTAGAPGTATSGIGGAGGLISIIGTAGGATSADTSTGGAGSALILIGGAGGAADTGGSSTGGAGGDVTITAGAGGSSTSGTPGAEGSLVLGVTSFPNGATAIGILVLSAANTLTAVNATTGGSTQQFLQFDDAGDTFSWIDRSLVGGNAFGVVTGDTGTGTADTTSDTLELQGATNGGITTLASDAPERVIFSITPIDLSTTGATVAGGDFLILSDSADSATTVAQKITITTILNTLDIPNAITGDGLVTRTANDTYTSRTITASVVGGDQGISIVDGDGISGDPTIGFDLVGLTTVTALADTDEFVIWDGSNNVNLAASTVKQELAVLNNTVQTLFATVVFGGGATQTIGTLPADGRVLRARVDINTIWDTTETIDIGINGGAADAIMPDTDNDPEILGIYEAAADYRNSTAGNQTVEAAVTNGGGPATGSALVIIEYMAGATA